MSQQSLFDEPAVLGSIVATAGRTDPDTSHGAAASLAHISSRLQARVLLLAYLRGAGGVTRNEVEACTGGQIRRDTASKRLGELTKAGWLEIIGTRRNSAGRQAQVYAIPERLWAEALVSAPEWRRIAGSSDVVVIGDEERDVVDIVTTGARL